MTFLIAWSNKFTLLNLNKTCASDTEASFLDLLVSILDGFVTTKIYNKQDDFDFDIVNFSFLDGIYMSHLIRFVRVSSCVDGFDIRFEDKTSRKRLYIS